MTGSPLLDDQIAEYRELKACELFLPWTGELLLSPASSGSVERPIGAMWGKGGSVWPRNHPKRPNMGHLVSRIQSYLTISLIVLVS